MPRSQSVSDAPRRLPEARMVQSLPGSMCLSTYRWPSITTRSILAPDLPGASSSVSRSVTRASSSARSARLPAAESRTGALHLGEQRGRPAAAAEDGVGDDAVIAHGQQVHVVGGVRYAALLPAQRVLHHFARPVVDRTAAQFVEMARVGEPARVLRADRVGAGEVQPPAGYRRVQHRIRVPDVAAGYRRALHPVQELVDHG